ncbi:MAG: peptidylprolyl isomerase [Candidatus Margulisbacteria bacterium]|nr:peptidylprolyl isomerase [Candidatus Margulisiibacteriota bacterium]
MLTFLRKKMKTIMIVVVVLFAASMFYGIGMTRGSWKGMGDDASKSLAKVNGKELDPARFREILSRIGRQFGDNISPQDMAFVQNLALGQTIDFTLMLEEAKRKTRVSNQELDMAIDSIMKQQNIPSKRELENALKRMGMSLSAFKNLIKDEILVQKMVSRVREGVVVTPDDLREIKASHILVSNEALAKDLLARVNKGEDLAALAQKYSIDTGSAGKGGDLGYFTTGMMVEPFEKAVFSLKIGQVSGIVKTSFGYHVIKVTDSRLRKFPGNEKDIEKAARLEKQEKTFRRWYSEIRGKAKIEIINPALRANDLRFRGQLLEAIAEYKKAIAGEPGNPFFHLFLGDTYMTIGRSELAISEYEAAISMAGGNPDFYLVLAKAYEKAGKKDLAVQQYRRASLVAGDNKAMHQRLLKLFEQAKLYGEVSKEKAEIARIEKKEKFEKSLQGQ